MRPRPPLPTASPLAIMFSLVLVCGCAASVNDLLEEVQYGDSESVREATIELGDYLGEKEAGGYPFDAADREAIQYLEELARKSPDAVTRACAISGLARLRSPDGTELFLAALRDEGAPWLIRLEGARALATRPDPRAAEPLAARLRAEPQLEVRIGIVRALEAVGGEVALRTILDAFLDNSRLYKDMRLLLYDALRRLSGETFHLEDSTRWRQYRSERFAEPPPAEKEPRAGGVDTAKPQSDPEDPGR